MDEIQVSGWLVLGDLLDQRLELGQPASSLGDHQLCHLNAYMTNDFPTALLDLRGQLPSTSGRAPAPGLPVEDQAAAATEE